MVLFIYVWQLPFSVMTTVLNQLILKEVWYLWKDLEQCFVTEHWDWSRHQNRDMGPPNILVPLALPTSSEDRNSIS